MQRARRAFQQAQLADLSLQIEESGAAATSATPSGATTGTPELCWTSAPESEPKLIDFGEGAVEWRGSQARAAALGRFLALPAIKSLDLRQAAQLTGMISHLGQVRDGREGAAAHNAPSVGAIGAIGGIGARAFLAGAEGLPSTEAEALRSAEPSARELLRLAHASPLRAHRTLWLVELHRLLVELSGASRASLTRSPASLTPEASSRPSRKALAALLHRCAPPALVHALCAEGGAAGAAGRRGIESETLREFALAASSILTVARDDAGAVDADAVDVGAVDAGAVDAGAGDSGAVDASARVDSLGTMRDSVQEGANEGTEAAAGRDPLEGVDENTEQQMASLRALWSERDSEREGLREAESRLRGAAVKVYMRALTQLMLSEALQAQAFGTATPQDAFGADAAVAASMGGTPRAISEGVLAACEQSAAASAQRAEQPACALLLRRLRAEPRLLALALQREGAMGGATGGATGGAMGGAIGLHEQESYIQLLLCSLYSDEWAFGNEPPRSGGFAKLAGELCSAHVGAAGGASLSSKSLLSRLVSIYLQAMPGGAAWLQSAIGPTLRRVAEACRVEGGGCSLLTDAMDVYLSLPADAKAEVDADVARGGSQALSDQLRVVQVMSARGAALCAACEALLDDVQRAMPRAPLALRALARELHAGYARSADTKAIERPADGARRLIAELLFSRYVLAALQTPEAYRMSLQLPGEEDALPLGGALRRDLCALSLGLERLLQGGRDGRVGGGRGGWQHQQA